MVFQNNTREISILKNEYRKYNSMILIFMAEVNEQANVISQVFLPSRPDYHVPEKKLYKRKHLPASASPWCWKGLEALDARVYKPAIF